MKPLMICGFMLLSASLAYGSDKFVGCTTDHDQVAVQITFHEAATQKDKVNVDEVFKHIAEHLSTSELQSRDGFDLFMSSLGDEARDSIDSIEGAPKVIGTCRKVKAEQ